MTHYFNSRMSTKSQEDTTKEEAKKDRTTAILPLKVLFPRQLNKLSPRRHKCDWCYESFDCIGWEDSDWCHCWQAIVTKTGEDMQYLAHYCCEEHFDDDLCPDDSSDDEVVRALDENLDINDYL